MSLSIYFRNPLPRLGLVTTSNAMVKTATRSLSRTSCNVQELTTLPPSLQSSKTMIQNGVRTHDMRALTAQNILQCNFARAGLTLSNALRKCLFLLCGLGTWPTSRRNRILLNKLLLAPWDLSLASRRSKKKELGRFQRSSPRTGRQAGRQVGSQPANCSVRRFPCTTSLLHLYQKTREERIEMKRSRQRF